MFSGELKQALLKSKKEQKPLMVPSKRPRAIGKINCAERMKEEEEPLELNPGILKNQGNFKKKGFSWFCPNQSLELKRIKPIGMASKNNSFPNVG